MGGSLLRVTNG